MQKMIRCPCKCGKYLTEIEVNEMKDKNQSHAHFVTNGYRMGKTTANNKLTAPAMQNLKRREEYFKSHPELPKAKWEIERIAQIKARKKISKTWGKIKKQTKPIKQAQEKTNILMQLIKFLQKLFSKLY